MTLADGVRATVHLVTTSDYIDGPSVALRRMIASVEAFREANPQIVLKQCMLLQRVAPGQAIDLPDWIDLMPVPDRLSLSAARNRMIEHILSSGLDDATIVAFPDDDAWYPPGTLERICTAFGQHANLDLWFCRYGTAASAAADIVESRPSLQQTLSFASSNTTVCSGRLLKSVGGFDEALGVGTPAGGGEDTEFAVRAYHTARRVLFWDVMAVGHRDGSPSIRAKYYAGSLRAIARHADASIESRIAWLRKIAVGCAFTVMGRMDAKAYLDALRKSRAL